ncbi:MAG: CoA synthetase [Gammaproteobacteria bacterium]|nr:CoA synthetase [Gammaproteobacteria bacterium]
MKPEIYLADIDSLAAMVPDGAKLAVPKNSNGVPCALVRAIVRRRVRDLHVVCVPTGGYATDLLIGAGCVATVETSAVTLDETGLAPCFGAAVRAGSIRILDSTCPAVYSGLRAGEKGIPFIPIRGLIGSDLLSCRPDYRVIDNPYADHDPIVLVPAIVPDLALIHVEMADTAGNVYVGCDRDLALMAHAARRTLVTAERCHRGSLLDDARLAAGTMSSIYVGAIVLAARGAWPQGLEGHYDEDLAHMGEYRRLAADRDGFNSYLRQYVGVD